MGKFRAFIAIDVELSSQITDIVNDLKNSGADIKLVKPENMHITLKFLGDTDEKFVGQIREIMEKSVENIKSFEIKLKNTGVFPNENYIKVVWIGIDQYEKLAEIAKKINEGLSKIGFKKEKRDFSPHLTIGRLKTGKNKDKILHIITRYENTEFNTFKIKKIKLIKSELTPKGPIYTTIEEVKI